MLADAVEATVRSNPRHSSEELERVVREIVLESLLDQLDESGLTLKELEAIRKAFVSVLQGVYHPRLQYPVLSSPDPTKSARRGQKPPQAGTGPVASATERLIRDAGQRRAVNP
jgi:hypothetical protein